MTKKQLINKITRLQQKITQLENSNKENSAVGRRLAALNIALSRSNNRLKRLILKDYHTGLFNRRYLEYAVEKELSYARRHNQPFSVIMLDIDYFKAINDAYGHQFGDIVLKHIAKMMRNLVRRHDTVIRFGGEEFIIIAPKTDRFTGLVLARRLLESANLRNFGNRSHIIKLKTSIAVASYPEDGTIIEGMDLVYIADQILRRVKEYGGNRVYSSKNMETEKLDIGFEAELGVDVRFLKKKVQRLAKRANQCLVEAIFAFSKTIGLKDRYTERHAEGIVSYAERTAKELGLDPAKAELVRKAAILHDLGKAGIAEEILRKKAKLSKEEYERIKRHPQIGADILKPIGFLRDIVPFILYHHERWDGKGYPSGLKGEEIPIGARIIAIADVYQSLTSNRPYRKAYPREEALEIIRKGSGTEYDPRVVEAFLKIAENN